MRHLKHGTILIAALAAALTAVPAAARDHHSGGTGVARGTGVQGGAAGGAGRSFAAPIGGGLRVSGPSVHTTRFNGNWSHEARGDEHHRRFHRGFGPGFAGGLFLGGGPYYWNDWGPYAYDDDYGYGAYAAAPEYAYPGRSVEYCMRRFKSYDPASGTYLGYDGLRHPCP